MWLQIDLWQAVGLLVTILGGFFGMAQLLLKQNQKHLDEKFAANARAHSVQESDSRRIERELMELKAELPRDYVRREDHTRVIGAIQVSIDNLRLTIERAIMQRPPQ